MKTPDRHIEPLSMRLLPSGRFGRVARVELTGENVPAVSLENAQHISAHIGQKKYQGLAMDWRACVMTHNVAELTEVAMAFGSHLPAGLRFAVIHRPDQLAHAIKMTRVLASSGFTARAFALEAEALKWLDQQDEAI
ncbi:hypothetical protein AB6B38_04045 [Glycocaulis abyssi]|uniref:STAS/SEC14 domain-containing protein n=1 Tax=Glycocaulis abyssi TaxID=1433403 RepID=A0ABV9N992_9PROT